MKRHLIYLLGAILAVVSYGCSSDDDVQLLDTELTIRLTMASEMNTREGGPRQLEGVDYWQHVTHVRVYLFRSDKEDGVFTLQSWTGEDGTGKNFIDVDAFKKTSIYKEKEFEQHTVIVKPKLPDGYYRLLAIGTDEDQTLFDVIPNAESMTDGEANTKAITWDAVVRTFNDSPITNEFFSGYSETVHISSSVDKSFISIELKRCVAGVLLYVKNIPTQYNGTDIDHIRLVLSGYSQTTDIVNRTWKSDAVESEIELAKFSADDAIKTEEGTHEEKGRYYAGRFVIPSHTGKLTAKPTMKLVYYDKNGTVLKTKNVVMIGQFDNEDNEIDYEYDYENTELELDKKRTHYNLLANHIYCIGRRSETVKEPIDLSEDSDEVKIIAYGSWQADVDIKL